MKLGFVFPDGDGSKPQVCDFLDPRVSTDDCKRMPGTSQANARAVLQRELARLKAAGLDTSKPDRILDTDASRGWASGSREVCPCLTHSRPSGLWLVSRGRRLSAAKTLRLQGICPEDWSWSMTKRQMRAAAGNAMTVPVLISLLRELLRVVDFGLVGSDRLSVPPIGKLIPVSREPTGDDVESTDAEGPAAMLDAVDSARDTGNGDDGNSNALLVEDAVARTWSALGRLGRLAGKGFERALADFVFADCDGATAGQRRRDTVCSLFLCL